jgi:hypothetical protein
MVSSPGARWIWVTAGGVRLVARASSPAQRGGGDRIPGAPRGAA